MNFAEQQADYASNERTHPQLTGWAPYAAVLLTSAIVASMIFKVFETSSTGTLAVQYLIWLLCVIVMVAKVRHGAPNHRLRSKLGVLLTLFLVALVVSTVGVWLKGVRADTGEMFLQVAALCYMAVPFFAMQSVSKSEDVKPAVLLTCHIILGLCLYSIAADLTGFTSHESGRGRYFGSLGDQTAWVLTLPLLVYFSSGRLVLAIVTGLTLALTGSRAPALVVLAGFLLLMLFSSGRRAQHALMLLALAAASFLQSNVFGTLVSRLEATQFSASDRVVTASVGLRDFANSPVFGNGYNSLPYLHPSTAYKIKLGILPSQTSPFVQMLSDGGLVLFVPYFLFMLAATAGGIALMKRSREINDGGVTSGIVAWLLAMLWINQSALWFVVGSYVGPLVLGMAGILSGYWARLGSSRPENAYPNVVTRPWPSEK